MTDSSDQTKTSGPLSVLRLCLNPRVLAALAVMGLVVWWAQPELIRSVLPVLLFLACPLSMVFMMRAMGGTSEHRSTRPTSPEPVRRVDELKERLARARAEEEVLKSELARLEAENVPPDATHLPEAGDRKS